MIAIEKEAAQAGFTPKNGKNTIENKPALPSHEAALAVVDSRFRGNDETKANDATGGNDEDPLSCCAQSQHPETVNLNSRLSGNVEAAKTSAAPALQLPVREMADTPSRLEQNNQTAGDAVAHASWLAVVQQLLDAGAAQALQRELAIQSECVAQGADWRTLRVEQNALRADSVREKLQNA